MLQQVVNTVDNEQFQSINQAYNNTFRPNRLTLGLVVPLEAYTDGPVPTMSRHIERVQLVEELGFSSIWLRDVSFWQRPKSSQARKRKSRSAECRRLCVPDIAGTALNRKRGPPGVRRSSWRS